MATTTPDPAPARRDTRSPSPEYAALLACIRLGAATDDLRAALARVTDWPRLRDLAIHQSVLPLFFAALSPHRDLVPQSLFEEVRLVNQANAERSLRQAVALLRIITTLGARHITALPYKGPVLSERAYGDLTMRYFQDLDLFVARSQVAEACEVLAGLGITATRPPADGAHARDGQFHDILEGHDLLIEVHWRTGPAFVPAVFDAEELLRRAQPGTLLGHPIFVLRPSDDLLALCVHGDAHRWAQLEHVATLARVLAGGAFGRPDRFVRRARARAALRRCLVGFALARDLAGAPLPPEFTEALAADAGARALARKAAELIETSDDLGDTRLISTLWRARSLDRRWDGARLAALQVFAPRDQGMMDHGESNQPVACEVFQRVRYLQRSLRRR